MCLFCIENYHYFSATSSVLRIRRRRSPLHQFAESLLERTRQATTQGGPVTVSLGVPGTNYVPTVTAVTSGSFPLHFERISEVNSSSIPSHHPQVFFIILNSQNVALPVKITYLEKLEHPHENASMKTGA